MTSLLRQGVDNIYNWEFKEANQVYLRLKQSYPGHPIPHLFRGMLTYWESFPLLPTSPAFELYEKDMNTCIKLCEKRILRQDEAEYLLANLGARGMLLLFYADNDESMQVISLAGSTYSFVKQAFDFTGTYADFYFITGLYKYYREAYPEAHPVYKTLAFLFPPGDKASGLRELKMSAASSLFLKAESHSFLSGIYISFENNYEQALHYSKLLHQLYPRNAYYQAVYIKNLLLVKRYDEAENSMKLGRARQTNKYFQAQLNIFQGILYEKKYKNLAQAESFYKKGIQDAGVYGAFAREYMAYAYYGLSRIAGSRGDSRAARANRKKADDLSAFEEVNFDN